MVGSAPSVARRMMTLAAGNAADVVVAYLCAWTAAETLIRSLSRIEGVRPQFSLRPNGTLRTHKVGDVKMPDLIPPRPDHQLRAALKHLPSEARDRLISHPAVRTLARRVPTLNGKPVRKDAYGQRLSGVLDVAMTRDPRYPVWCTVDVEAMERYLTDSGTPAVAEELVWQVAIVLRTVQSNLMVDDEDADATVARAALPLVRIVVEGWLSEGTGCGSASVT